MAAVDADGRGTLCMKRVVPLPEELTLILGEFLYQLRAALDNCLYAVAVIVSGSNPPPGASALQWPICDTAEAFSKQRSRLKHLPERLVACLEAIQPYQADLPAWNSLRLLNDLARVDRHRALHLVTMVTVESTVVADNRVVKNPELNIGDLHDGGVILTFDYRGSEKLGPEHIDGQFEFDVELADVERSPGPHGKVMRPWGTLARRLRSMHQATLEYTEGLVYIATHPDEEAGPSTSTPGIVDELE
ncbi:hypothetical protein [Terrabacter sp. 2RAF25]|uniref:hypothetical protein n=1 Tax=Terrabacter sp. 2RAF25 TaxID=3232998 RepID=UPI003F96A789